MFPDVKSIGKTRETASVHFARGRPGRITTRAKLPPLPSAPETEATPMAESHAESLVPEAPRVAADKENSSVG